MRNQETGEQALRSLREQVWALDSPEEVSLLLGAAWTCLNALLPSCGTARVDLIDASARTTRSFDIPSQTASEVLAPDGMAPDGMAQAGTESTELVVPMDCGSLVLGGFASRTCPPEEAAAARDVGRVLSRGFTRLADMQRLADHTRDLEEKDRLLTAYQEIGAVTLASLDLDEVLDNLAESIVSAGIFRSMMISLVDQEEQAVKVVRYVFGGGQGGAEGPRISVRSPGGVVGLKYDLGEDSARGEAARTGEMRILDEGSASQAQTGEAADDAGGGESTGMGTVSCFIPVSRGDVVLAVLTVFCRADEKYDLLGRLEVMRPLLKQVAVALEHARLFREAQEARQEALEARRLAEDASRAKSDFLASMSHEIRTPINAIVGMADLLAGMDLGHNAADHVEAIASSADALQEIVSDILDLSKIEAGKLSLEPARLALRESLEGVVRPFSLKAAESGVSLSCEIAPEVPEGLIGDALRLRQVLVNLLSNAVKFTPKGSIEVSVCLADAVERDQTGARGDDMVCLHFSVRDSGIGIAAARRDAIFDSFTQADGSTTRRFGGTGLGLAIASQLVRLMDGRIWVDSEEGSGSIFHFTAVFGRADPSVSEAGEAADLVPVPEADVAPISPLHILLVEDMELNRRAAAGLLKREGHTVALAESGGAALDRLAEGSFDMILMDLEMPDMDGLQTTAAIREMEEGEERHVPIIGLTAHAMPGDRQRCLSSGMDGYVPKPMRMSVLHAEIRRVVPRVEARDAGEGDFAAPPEDLAGALELLGGDTRLLGELAGLFLEECPTRMAHIAEALASGHGEALAAAAHGIKGMVRTLGMAVASVAAEDLRAAGLKGDFARAREIVAVLSREIEKARPDLVQAMARGEE